MADNSGRTINNRAKERLRRIAVIFAIVLFAAAAVLLVKPFSVTEVRAENKANFSLSTDEPSPGGTFTLTLGFDCDIVITGAMVTVEFGSKVEYVSNDKTGMLADTVDSSDSGNGKLTVLYAADDGGTKKGTLCVINLKVADGAPRDTTETIKATLVSYSDENFYEYESGTVYSTKIYIPPAATQPPTATPTPTPSKTPTPTKTPTQTPTKTPSPTPTKTPDPTRTPTLTPETTIPATDVVTPTDGNGTPDNTDISETATPDVTADDTSSPSFTPDNTDPANSGELPGTETAPVSETPDVSPATLVPTEEKLPTATVTPATDVTDGPTADNIDRSATEDSDTYEFSIRTVIIWIFAALIVGIWTGIAVGFLIWGRNRTNKNKKEKSRGKDVFTDLIIVILCASMLFGLGRAGLGIVSQKSIVSATEPDNTSENIDDPADTSEPGEATSTEPVSTPVDTENTEPAGTDSQYTDVPSTEESFPTDGQPTETQPTEPAPTDSQPTDVPATDVPATDIPATDVPADTEVPTNTDDITDTPTPTEPEATDETPVPTEETATPDPTATEVPTPSPTRTPYPTRTPTAVPEATTPPTLGKLTPPPVSGSAGKTTETDGREVVVTDVPATGTRAQNVAALEENTTYRLSDFIQTLCYIAYGLAGALLLIGVIRILWLLIFKKDIVPPAEKEKKKKKSRLNKDINSGDMDMKQDGWS